MKLVPRILFFIIPVTLIVFLFQNCTSSLAKFRDSSSQEADSHSSMAGNGQGYEGKPQGTFIRVLPDDKCKDERQDFFGKLVFSPSENKLTQRVVGTCDYENKIISDSDIIYSTSQQIVIGSADGLYVSEEWKSSQPLKTIEAWCQQTTLASENVRRDLIVLYKEGEPQVEGTLWTRVIGGLAPSVTTTSLNFTREIKNQILSYDSESLRLNLATNSVASSLGYFEASWTAKSSLYPDKVNFHCRLGYRFDGVIWPSRPFNNLNFNIAKHFNGGESAILNLINPNSSTSSLVRWDLATEKMTPLTPPLETSNQNILSYFSITQDEAYVVYKAKTKGELTTSLLSSKLDGTGTFKLSQANFDNSPSCGFKGYSAKTKKMFFTEPSSRADIGPDFCFLRANNIEGDSYQQIVNEISINDETNQLFMYDEYGSVIFRKNPYGYQNGEWFQLSLIDMSVLSLAPYSVSPLGYTGSKRFIFLGDSNVPMADSNLYFKDFSTGIVSRVNDSIYSVKALSEDERYAITNLNSQWFLFDRLTLISTPIDTSGLVNVASISLLKNTTGLLITELFATVGSRIYTSDLSGKNRRLASTASYIYRSQVLPSIDKILYSIKNASGAEEYYLMNIQDLSSAKISGIDNRKYNIWPEYMPGLKSYQFVNDRYFFTDDIDGDGYFELFVMYFDGRGIVQLNNRFTEYGGVITFSVITPQKVLFQTNKNNKNMMFLWQELP